MCKHIDMDVLRFDACACLPDLNYTELQHAANNCKSVHRTTPHSHYHTVQCNALLCWCTYSTDAYV